MNDIEPVPAAEPSTDHEPPMILRLGTLADLTLGGTIGTGDGFGGAGDLSVL